jgi:hypothetical protein
MMSDWHVFAPRRFAHTISEFQRVPYPRTTLKLKTFRAAKTFIRSGLTPSPESPLLRG